MKKHMTVLLMVGMLALCLPLHLTAQQRETTLRKEIVKVNYIEVQEAWNILVNYRSPRGKIQMQRNRNMLIIEDSPEFVDKILSILKELDVKPMDLQFTVDVILGDKRSPDETVPPDPRISSDPLFAELRNLLKYDSLKRLDTTLIKVQDNGRSSQQMGGEGIGLQLRLYPRHIREGNKDAFQVEISLRQTTKRFRIRRTAPDDSEKEIVEYAGTPLEKPVSLLETSLTLRSGERQVVGVSKLNGGDVGLILVVEGKVIK